MGISPGGARESSPWREPWEQTRTARSPGGAKEPFHGDSPIAGHEGPAYAPTGWRVSGPVPQGLRPGLFSSAPNGASNRARTRLARREELGIKAQTRVENVETPEGGPGNRPPFSCDNSCYEMGTYLGRADRNCRRCGMGPSSQPNPGGTPGVRRGVAEAGGVGRRRYLHGESGDVPQRRPRADQYDPGGMPP